MKNRIHISLIFIALFFIACSNNEKKTQADTATAAKTEKTKANSENGKNLKPREIKKSNKYWKALQENLSLSTEQIEQLKTANNEYFNKSTVAYNNGSFTQELRKTYNEDRIKAIRTVLKKQYKQKKDFDKSWKAK